VHDYPAAVVSIPFPAYEADLLWPVCHGGDRGRGEPGRPGARTAPPRGPPSPIRAFLSDPAGRRGACQPRGTLGCRVRAAGRPM